MPKRTLLRYRVATTTWGVKHYEVMAHSATEAKRLVNEGMAAGITVQRYESKARNAWLQDDDVAATGDSGNG